ncbi:hypothetical protein P280DRAFT_514479 [Massarina eburnea CBS 473.64]|uniref:Cell wall protein PhiA n=1 Tax=Massarina eburnea CBS 473.64 TaxID=1395130 RepID=A0A6A6SDU8_9PLEO|nr:hypothetical protein P280DRAFT_514479 [Massarina eburnea CBS 473.64]
MRFSTLSLATLLSATISSALPTALTEFYLVTSSQADPSSNSSQLQGVSATTPFDESPISGTKLLLRLLEPGYNTLPKFNLDASTGVLSTTLTSSNVPTQWNSTTVQDNAELQFVAEPQKANIGLGGKGEYLLSVGNATDGWTICESGSGESVLWWKGTAEGCSKTYLHAVTDAPYQRKLRVR